MIRRAMRADIVELAALETECFGLDAWSPDLLARDLASDSYRVIGSTNDEKLVGYGAISVAADVADLQRLAVCGSARRTGVARLLLAELLIVSIELGAERILLEVASDNAAAVRFYASAGFTQIGRRTNYYAGAKAALVLERPLS